MNSRENDHQYRYQLDDLIIDQPSIYYCMLLPSHQHHDFPLTIALTIDEQNSSMYPTLKILIFHEHLFEGKSASYIQWCSECSRDSKIMWSRKKMITESDITWAICIMILYRSLNDQENGHDLRCLTALSVKMSRFASELPPNLYLLGSYRLTIVEFTLDNCNRHRVIVISNPKSCLVFDL